jgi:hypothetical protein
VPEVRRLPAVPGPDEPDAGTDDHGPDPDGPDGPDGPDPDDARPAEAAWAAVAAGADVAARPQTVQYPSSIVPPQLAQVLIATVLPSSAPPSGLPSSASPSGPSSRQLAYWSAGGPDGGPSQCW